MEMTNGLILKSAWIWPTHGSCAAADVPECSNPEAEADANKADQASDRKHLRQLELQAQAKKVRPFHISCNCSLGFFGPPVFGDADGVSDCAYL